MTTLQEAKEIKTLENSTKADTKRYNKTFTVTLQNQECEFDTNIRTQADLLTAFSVCSSGGTYDDWVCNNKVVLDLTLEDVITIANVFKQESNVYLQWKEYQDLIDNASTVQEVESINIVY